MKTTKSQKKDSNYKFLRISQVLERIPVSVGTWRRGVRAGRYPQPIKLGPKITVWLEADIDAFLEKIVRAKGKKAKPIKKVEKNKAISSSLPPGLDCAGDIWGWIAQDEVDLFTARDALERVKGRFPTMKEVSLGLDVLMDDGFIFEIKNVKQTGRPSRRFVVNPETLRQVKTSKRRYFESN